MNPVNQTYIFAHPNPGCLRIAGPDQRAFIQRQTTNDVDLLKPNRAVLTVLTSPAARILDVFYLIDTPGKPGAGPDEPGCIEALSLPGRAGITARYLKGRIFFMDKVTLEDASHEYQQLDLFGPGADSLLERLEIPVPPQVDEVVVANVSGASLRILGLNPQVGLGYRLVVPSDQYDTTLAAMAALGAQAIEPEDYEILRIEAGLPIAGRELTEDYTPLEVGLTGAISDRKGCYTGQEVIARQVTYDKVTRRLAGLRLEAGVRPGESVQAEGRAVGVITSAAISPRHGPVALAVLKRPHHEPGASVTVGDGVSAQVSSLPF